MIIFHELFILPFHNPILFAILASIISFENMNIKKDSPFISLGVLMSLIQFKFNFNSNSFFVLSFIYAWARFLLFRIISKTTQDTMRIKATTMALIPAKIPNRSDSAPVMMGMRIPPTPAMT